MCMKLILDLGSNIYYALTHTISMHLLLSHFDKTCINIGLQAMKWSPILTLMPQLSEIQYLYVTMGLGSKWVTHIYRLMWKDIRTLFDAFNSIWDKVHIWVASLFCHNF
jgi:hypothetical protein